MNMNIITDRDQLADILSRVKDGERIILKHRGKKVAALVPLADLKMIEELEDEIDRRGFLSCMAWVGTGVLWTMTGGILRSETIGSLDKLTTSGLIQSAADLSFVGGGTHTYAAMGSDLGISFDGYEDNFAWGKLIVGAGDLLNVDGEALYLGVLDLRGGLASISGSGNIYYDLREPANSYLGGKSYQMAGGGMIAAVPEPMGTSLMLLALTPGVSRRRAKTVCVANRCIEGSLQ